MGILNKFLNKVEEQATLKEISDTDIVAPTEADLFDVKEVKDPMFSKNIIGKGIALKLPNKRKVVLCSPANGKITALFPTGHAFGITMRNGIQILVHCGIDTVKAKGDGFHILDKRPYDEIKAGEPIVEVDVAKLSGKYDMSTILIVLKPYDEKITYIKPQHVKRGQKII